MSHTPAISSLPGDTRLVLAVDGNSDRPGARLCVWSRVAGEAGRQWAFGDDGDDDGAGAVGAGAADGAERPMAPRPGRRLACGHPGFVLAGAARTICGYFLVVKRPEPYVPHCHR